MGGKSLGKEVIKGVLLSGVGRVIREGRKGVDVVNGVWVVRRGRRL